MYHTYQDTEKKAQKKYLIVIEPKPSNVSTNGTELSEVLQEVPNVEYVTELEDSTRIKDNTIGLAAPVICYFSTITFILMLYVSTLRSMPVTFHVAFLRLKLAYPQT